MLIRFGVLILAPFAVLLLLITAACSDNGGTKAGTKTAGTNTSEATGTRASTKASGTSTTAKTPGTSTASAGCFVHLFDSDNFDAHDDNFKLTEPGRYGDLNNLPGAHHHWDDEADSLEVGASAKVTIWGGKAFGGSSQELGPGKHAHLDPEPRSLELTCS